MKQYMKFIILIVLLGIVMAEVVILWGSVQEEKSFQKQYEKLSVVVESQSVELESLKAEEGEMESQIDAFEADKAEKEEAIASLKETLETLKKEKEELNTRLQDAKKEQSALEEQIQSLEKQIETLKQELASF